MKCGWGDGCAVDLPKRGLCDEHKAIIRALDDVLDAAETDARVLAVELMRVGEMTRTDAADILDFNAARLKRAIALAERLGWVTAGQRLLTPGDTVPPGRIPREVRAAMLTRYVRAQRPRTVTFAEAAAAIGLTKGGVPRVAAYAREQGWIRTTAGLGGGIAAV